MTADERLLIDFVVWRCRAGNLPLDVRAAAARVSHTPRTRQAGTTKLTDGRYRLSVFDRKESPPVDSRPLALGEAVEEALLTHPLYLLVSDYGAAIAQGWEAPAGGPSLK